MRTNGWRAFRLLGLIAIAVAALGHVAFGADYERKKNAATLMLFPMVDSATPASFKTGLTVSVTAQKCTGVTAASCSSHTIADSPSELGSTGMYALEITAAEANYSEIVLKVTATDAADSFLHVHFSDQDRDSPVSLVDDAITAATYDESTAFPLKSADTGSTQVARVGADGDTLETLSDEIASVQTDTTAIQAKTDNLPASPAAVGSAMTLAADAITASTFDESTAYPLVSADADTTRIFRTGVYGGTVATLNSTLTNGLSAVLDDTAAILGYTDGIESKTDNLPASPAAVGSEMALVNGAITAGKYDEATAFPVGSVDSGATEIARTGADSDTLEALSDEIAALNDPTALAIAGAVWEEDDSHVTHDTYGKHVNTLIEWLAAVRDDVVNLDGFNPTTDGMVLGDVAHGGSAATLTLASVVVTNPGGTAVALTSSGGSGDGLYCKGNGTNGNGIEAVGGTIAYGIYAEAGATVGHGIYAKGIGSGGAGIGARGGTGGSGIKATAGGANADAITCTSDGGTVLLDADVVQEIVDAIFAELVDGKSFDSMLTALTAVSLGKTIVDVGARSVAFKRTDDSTTKATITYGGTGERTTIAWDDD